jgi:hypothetical protein
LITSKIHRIGNESFYQDVQGKNLSMKIVNPAIFVLSFALVVTGCRKGDHKDPDTNTEKYRLRAINYITFNGTANYSYNTDSTLKKIQYSNGTSGYTVAFEYDNRRVTLISVSSSLYEHRYNYDNGRISTTVDTQIGQPHLGNKFFYSYNADGTVSELRYYDLNEAGEELVYSSTYEYNSERLPSRIISVNGSNKVIWTIESYSKVCDFNEWSFISASLNEMYELYNYPVLSKLNRLPKRVVQSMQQGSAAPTVQKVIESDFTIIDERLDKIRSSISYPNHPNYNTSSEAIFDYE